MVNGKTKSGFEFICNGRLLHDVEFLEDFAAVQSGDGLEVFSLIRRMLGEEQKKALYDHLRNDEGVVTVEALRDELADIFGVLAGANETKN